MTAESARRLRQARLESIRAKFPAANLGALASADRPPREFLFDGLLPVGAHVSLVGSSGTGKSNMALSWSLAAARGEAWAGLAPTKAVERAVLYIDMENNEDDLAERLVGLGETPESLAALAYLALLRLPDLPGLDTAEGGRALADLLDAYLIQPGDLLVLDSTQRLVDGPEDAADTMRAYYRHTAMMLKRRGVTVLRTDNTGKDAGRGARGSAAKKDDLDVEWSARRTGTGLRLDPTKARVSVRALDVDVKTDEGPGGLTVVAGYLNARPTGRPGVAARTEREPREVLLQALADADGDPEAKRSARALSGLLGNGGRAREATGALLDGLRDEGLVTPRGSESRRRWFLTDRGRAEVAR